MSNRIELQKVKSEINIVNRISRRTVSVHKRNERREKWQISECFHSR